MFDPQAAAAPLSSKPEISNSLHSPSGSKDPNNGVLGPKYYNIHGVWALKPYYLGPWPLRVDSQGNMVFPHVQWLRESELKHGRCAMLAVVGIFAQLGWCRMSRVSIFDFARAIRARA